jgi:glutathione reductase (NADPH)
VPFRAPFKAQNSRNSNSQTGPLLWGRPHIYAVGDVTHRFNLTPVAIREGHAFADTVFGKRAVKVDHIDIPTAVFTQPQVGTVGLTEAQARAQFAIVDVYKAAFRPLKATLSGSESRVLMKLVVDAGSDRVVGCHIVGSDAAELVQVIAIAVKMKAARRTSTPLWRCTRPPPRNW